MKDAILARIVQKVGESGTTRMPGPMTWSTSTPTKVTCILAKGRRDGEPVAEEFGAFHAGLQANINDSITAASAIGILSQDLITSPCSRHFFPSGGFATNNPVSISMQRMVQALT